MSTIPTLPFSIRALNAALGALGPLTPFGRPLNADTLHAIASKQTGLTDFGKPTYHEGLDVLFRSLNDEADLTPLGRIIAREETLMALKTRLQLEAHHKKFPEIGAAPIHRPIIMMGMGRSGTTILHELFALDPNNRIPATWEVDRPFPAPEAATYHSDPRIEETQRQLDRTDLILPEFKKIHRMGATLPQECVRWTAGEFLSVIFGCSYNVPGYMDWFIEKADMAPGYAYHRRFLQYLQWKFPADRWVLKSPGHLWHLKAMMAAYPDARLIQTHRDPLKTTASLTSLICNLRVMTGKHVDPVEVGRQWSKWNAAGFNNSVDFRKSGLIPEDRIIDISFYEFMEDPIRQVQAIYDYFDMELSTETRKRMSDYLEVNTAVQHGAHKYNFHDFGFDIDEERERVKPYQEYFDIPVEVK